MIKDKDLESGLTEEHIQTLITQFGKGHGDWFTEEQGAKVLEWAEKTLIDYTMLKAVLDKEVVVKLDKRGEVLFKKDSRKKGTSSKKS